MTKNIRAMGNRWERQVAKELDGRKQPSSGAFGTQAGIPELTGDVVVEIPWLSRPLHIECKYGYGGAKSMSVKREWLTKVRAEAVNCRRYPVLAIKFRDVMSEQESAKVICMNFDTWKQILQEFEYIYLEYLALLKEQYDDSE